MLLSPSERRGFFTIPACAQGPDPVELEIEEVEVLHPWADVEVTWKIAWPPKGNPVLVGSGYGTAPRRFDALPSKGIGEPCSVVDDSPVLAVEFPRTESDHLGFSDVRVHYRADGATYRADYDVSMGLRQG